MTKVGDYFPDQDKRNFAQTQVAPGQILYLHCDFTVPQAKNKYLVVVSLEDEACLALVVNSEWPRWVVGKPHAEACQVSLSPHDYPFLDHESFVNCAEIIDSVDQANMIEQITNDISRAKGPLQDHTKAAIVAAIGQARTIPAWQKDLVKKALA